MSFGRLNANSAKNSSDASPRTAAANSLRGRRRRPVESELDITPMIDVTFLLLIFFLVTATIDRQAGVELPPARNGSAVSLQDSIVFTVIGSGDRGVVFAGDTTSDAARLPTEDQQFQARIVELVEQGERQGAQDVLIKAERHLPHREVARVIRAVSQISQVRVHLAVLEVD